MAIYCTCHESGTGLGTLCFSSQSPRIPSDVGVDGFSVSQVNKLWPRESRHKCQGHAQQGFELMSSVCQSPGTHFYRPPLASDGLMFHLLPLNTLCRTKTGQCPSLLEGPWSERGQHVKAAQPGTGSLITGTQRGVGQGSACKHKSAT